MERAYFDARTQGWSRAPIVEMLIPSVVDDTLAPPGGTSRACSASTCIRTSRAVLPGTTWDDTATRSPT